LAGRGIFPPDAEDLVQEVFATVFFQLKDGKFRGTSGIYTWVIGILNHKVADYRESRRRAGVDIDFQSCVPRGVAEVAVASPGGIDAEERVIICEALDRIPRLHRVILLLNENEGWTTDEIAERLRMASGTVGRKLWEARRKLRQIGKGSSRGPDRKALKTGEASDAKKVAGGGD
jgi:RNA polymerase sigma factor (sigma-70 family)